jgi:hypothetical protein
MTSTFTSAGITLDRYAEIKARLIALAEAEFGDSVNTAKDSFLGHMIENIALILGENNGVLQSVYDAGSVKNSSGTRLDGLLELTDIDREEAAFSTVTVTLTAAKATTVAAGKRYGTTAGVIFAIDSQVVFGGSGTADVSATCTVAGANAAAIGEVDQIVDSVYGITAVTNAAAASPGRLQQTDAELKTTHTTAMATSGDDDAGSIYEAVIAVSGVSAVYIHDNDTPYTVLGVPAKTIHVSAIGGTDLAVATAISQNKTASVPTHGSTSQAVYNTTTAQSKTINFDRAVAVPIFIDMDITKVTGLAPDDAEAQIRAELVTHFSTFRIADDVVYGALNKPIYTVPGVIVNELYVGIAASPTGTSDVSMSALQLAQLTTAQATTAVTISVT